MTEKSKAERMTTLFLSLATAFIVTVWLISVYHHKDSAVVKPSAASSAATIKMVAPADYASELDNTDNVLIQLCKPEQCEADRAVLERVRPGFDQVKFVQMSSRDNVEFAQRLESEQQQVAKASKSQSALVYPVYIFKSADLQVAPPLQNDDELKQFIATNISKDDP